MVYSSIRSHLSKADHKTPLESLGIRPGVFIGNSDKTT